MIINKTNEIIVHYKELIKKTNEQNEVATDDINTIILAKKYGLTIKEFFYCSEIDYHKETWVIIEELKSYSSHTSEISRKTYESLVNKDNSIGLFAIIELKYNQIDAFKNKEFLVVCDGLEIPGNLGTIYRTVDSAACEGVIMVNSVTHPFNNKNTIASRGCNLIVPTVEMSFEEASNYLIQNGFSIYLGEPILGKNYQEYDYQRKIAIVVGNERFGIDSRWYELEQDFPEQIKKVFIPMFGSNNSLNVSVAASILIYEAKMKRMK